MRPSSPLRRAIVVLTGLVLGIAWAAAAAGPPAPPPPKAYRAVVRYRIRAGRNVRVAQFLELTRYLESIGFHKDPGPDNEAEDVEQTRMTGTIAAADARKILQNRHVQSILLVPEGYTLPAEPDARVKVQIELAGGLSLPSQNALAEQVMALLRRLGFQEAIGYDNRGHTRLVGTVPANQLNLLLEDLRWQGSGWLTPDVPVAELPLPIRSVWPVTVVEVTPEPADIPPARALTAPPAPPAGREYFWKITPDLGALAAQEAQAAKPTRMEVILAFVPAAHDVAWRQALSRAAPGLVIEGELGPLLTVVGRPDQAANLAALPTVSTVRLPRPGVSVVRPAAEAKGGNRAALDATGLDRLHKLGHRGKGVRVAVVDGDFRGFEKLVGKQLPAGTRLVDLTTERNHEIRPDPPAEGDERASGTEAALAVALAAPEADLTLIRIDPAAPYQLQEVARYISGEVFRTESLLQRQAELAAESERLNGQREELLRERQGILENFGQDPATVEKREAYFKKQAAQDRDEAEFQRRFERYRKLLGDLAGLKGIRIVACGLVWNEGYPADGSSALSRYFDDRPFRAAVWFQSAGDARGQAWADLFRDADGNGVMEFAAPAAPLRAERWTRELDFLAWQPAQGKPAVELPAKTPLRISVQWREAHDPEFWRRGEDLYRQPLVDVQLVVLRQRDPSGTEVPADDLEVVARSVGWPERLDNQPATATYEQTVEFTVDTPGRYALRVEGRPAAGDRPASVPTLPALRKDWELRPRIFLQTLGTAAASGRVVFLDYATDQGTLGMPADARGVTSVGSADPAGRPEPYSGVGPAWNLELLRKPDVLAYDRLDLGSAGGGALEGTTLATSFAAGITASALSAGLPGGSLSLSMRVPPGGLLRVPPLGSAKR